MGIVVYRTFSEVDAKGLYERLAEAGISAETYVKRTPVPEYGIRVSVADIEAAEQVKMAWREERSEREAAYELPAVLVTREEYDRALLKAGMAFNGSLEALIRRAIAEYTAAPRTPKACPNCHKVVRMETATVDETLTNGVTVTGIPTGACPECQTALRPPLALLGALEEVLGDSPSGSTVAFADLLSGSQ